MTGAFPDALVDPGLDRHKFTDRYRSGEWRSGLEPTCWFNSQWYAEQHNDWLHHRSPFDHFVDRGLDMGVDPSPFVDMAVLASAWPQASPRDRFARLILSDDAPTGLHRDASELAVAQDRFFSSINVNVQRVSEPGSDALVWLQQPPGRPIPPWVTNERAFDVLINRYADNAAPSGDGDHELAQAGTKFSGVPAVLGVRPELLSSYRWVMLIDHDVNVSTMALDECFSWCRRLDASLAQPTLDSSSSTAWPALKLTAGETLPAEPVAVNAAEIMMPIMRIDFLMRTARWFRRSISGYGLDHLWAQMLADTGTPAWRLPVVASHVRAPDMVDGEYYRFLRKHEINPNAEWWVLRQKLGIGGARSMIGSTAKGACHD